MRPERSSRVASRCANERASDTARPRRRSVWITQCRVAQRERFVSACPRTASAQRRGGRWGTARRLRAQRGQHAHSTEGGRPVRPTLTSIGSAQPPPCRNPCLGGSAIEPGSDSSDLRLVAARLREWSRMAFEPTCGAVYDRSWAARISLRSSVPIRRPFGSWSSRSQRQVATIASIRIRHSHSRS